MARSALVRDVVLASNGELRGTLVDRQGNRLADRSIVVTGPELVRVTRSGSRGEFRFAQLGSGLRVISVDGRQQTCRLWAPGTAPPCAVQVLLVVGGSGTVRGLQKGRPTRQWLAENGGQVALITAFIALPIIYATKPFGS